MSVPARLTPRAALLGSVLLGSVVLGSVLTSAAPAPMVQARALHQTFGGVLLEATLTPRGRNTVTGAWYGGGRAKLLRCTPRCTVVESIPLDNPLTLGQQSAYRIVLAGHFRNGQRLPVVLRFEDLDLATVEVPVGP